MRPGSPQRPGSEPAPEQRATQKEIDGQDQPQGQPRQLQPRGQGQDHRDQDEGQDRQDQGQDAAGQGQGVDGDVDQDQDADRGSDASDSQGNREGANPAEVQGKKQKVGTEAKGSANQEDAGFLANFYLLALVAAAAQNPGTYLLKRQKPIPVTGLALVVMGEDPETSIR